MSRFKLQNEIRRNITTTACEVVEYYQGEARTATDVTGCPRTVRPSCVCNEISSQHDVDSNYGREERLRKFYWHFHAIVNFPCEVDLNELECAFEEPLTVETREGSGRFYRVYLSDTEINHPMQSAGHGTEYKMTFRVKVPRV